MTELCSACHALLKDQDSWNQKCLLLNPELRKRYAVGEGAKLTLKNVPQLNCPWEKVLPNTIQPADNQDG